MQGNRSALTLGLVFFTGARNTQTCLVDQRRWTAGLLFADALHICLQCNHILLGGLSALQRTLNVVCRMRLCMERVCTIDQPRLGNGRGRGDKLCIVISAGSFRD